MGIALFETTLSYPSLKHFKETGGLIITLRSTFWVIFGRVVIKNSDGDEQNASVQLRCLDGYLIDRTDVRIPSKISSSITVQGNFRPTHEFRVEMACATYDGEAIQASLIAIEVDATYTNTIKY